MEAQSYVVIFHQRFQADSAAPGRWRRPCTEVTAVLLGEPTAELSLLDLARDHVEPVRDLRRLIDHLAAQQVRARRQAHIAFQRVYT